MSNTPTPPAEPVKDTAPDGNFQIIPADVELAPESKISIEHGFGQYFTKARDLIAQTATINSPKMAKAARLEFKALRVAAEKERQRLKAESLRFGKAVDGANNILLAAIVPHEERLEEIEKADERRIAAEIAARGRLRLDALTPLGVTLYTADALGRMSDEDYNPLLEDARALYAQRVERERQAEADRLAAEVAAAKERERIRLDNERLLREIAEREAREKQERERVEREKKEADARHAQELAEAARVAQAEKDRIEAQAKKDRDAAEAKALKEKQALQKKLDEEKAAREKADEAARLERQKREKEQMDRIEAEQKRLAEEARKQREADEAAEKAAQAPDREKLIAYAAAIQSIPVPTVKSKKAKSIVTSFVADIQDVAETLRAQAEKL